MQPPEEVHLVHHIWVNVHTCNVPTQLRWQWCTIICWFPKQSKTSCSNALLSPRLSEIALTWACLPCSAEAVTSETSLHFAAHTQVFESFTGAVQPISSTWWSLRMFTENTVTLCEGTPPTHWDFLPRFSTSFLRLSHTLIHMITSQHTIYHSALMSVPTLFASK